VEMMKNPFGAKPPKPGEGPSKEERESGFYDVLFVADGPDGESLHLGVKGKYDPGYGSTSRMLSETGIALLNSDADGGVGTPGAFLGEALVNRLQEHADIQFAVEN
ncbi:MAG: saccharopine dehydrogenase, partial [Pseudomonadota bacterium]